MTGDRQRLPQPLIDLLQTPVVQVVREVCGLSACVVGGSVRDALLGRRRADIDVVVAGRGRHLAQQLAAALDARPIDLGGERFASYRLVGKSATVDLWDREEQSLEEDLRRRDFTVNSMALELATERLADPFGGLQDLGRRRLRATNPKSFADDPLRVLRLARFAIDLDLVPVPETLELARASAAAVPTVAIERTRGEIERLLRRPDGLEAVRLLARLDLYPLLWEAQPAGDAVERAVSTLADLEVWSEILDQVTGGLPVRVDPYRTSMAVLYLSATGASAEASAAPRASMESSRLLTRRDRRHLGLLVEPPHLPSSVREARWFLHRWGRDWLDAAAVWGSAGAGGELSPAERLRRVQRLADLARRHAREIFDPETLVDGGEIGRRLGTGPGPEVGRCLEAIRRRQVEGRLTTRRQALEFVDAWADDARR